MHFEAGKIYHIYNRSNEIAFHNRDNYLYFLKKVNQFISPKCEILAWCLMPNHFHLLIKATRESEILVEDTYRERTQELAKAIGTLLSTYTQGLNKSIGRRGSLWAHQTKSKCINDCDNYFPQVNDNYPLTCMHYIHQNPIVAKLSKKMEDWEFSSFQDLIGLRNGKLVNKNLTFSVTDCDENNFYEQSNFLLDEAIIRKLYEI